MTEKEIESYLAKCAVKVGGRSYKWVSPGETGVPDRIVVLPSKKVLFVEVKKSKGIVLPRQQVVHRELRDLGQSVRVVYDKEDVDALFWIYGYEV